jgi:hypothetical protein
LDEKVINGLKTQNTAQVKLFNWNIIVQELDVSITRLNRFRKLGSSSKTTKRVSVSQVMRPRSDSSLPESTGSALDSLRTKSILTRSRVRALKVQMEARISGARDLLKRRK